MNTCPPHDWVLGHMDNYSYCSQCSMMFSDDYNEEYDYDDSQDGWPV